MISLLIDGNPLIWRAAYGTGPENNGVITSILNLFADITQAFQFDQLMIFWDEGKSRWRTSVYPEYKKQREARREKEDIDFEEVFSQAKEAQKFLNFYHVPQLVVRGIEADDLISWVSEYRYDKHGDTVIIATSDKDLWQLIRSDGQKQIIVYDPAKKCWVNEEYVKDFLGICPSSIRFLKSLAGDASDNIPGAKGIGPKTSATLLTDYRTIGNLFSDEAVKELKEKKTTSRILFYEDEVETAYRIVNIPTLDEVGLYVNSEELSNLEAQFSLPKAVDMIRARMLVDRLGILRFDPSRIANAVGGYQDFNFISGCNVEIPSDRNFYSLEEVDEAISMCSDCKLRQDCSNYGPTLPTGYEDAFIMVVGRNPGYDELIAGRPFVGRAGKRLDKVFDEVGLTSRELWITNVCKCYSLDNRPVEYGEIQACLKYLKAEISLIKPKLIIALGNEAMAAVTSFGCSGITSHCGEIVEAPRESWCGNLDIPVILFPHPSAALRSPKFETLMQFATKKLKTFLDERGS